MTTPIPYICTRCLRTSKRLLKPTTSLRTYHTRTSSSPRPRSLAFIKPSHTPSYTQSLSSSSRLSKPALSPQTRTSAPPPPQSTVYSTTTLLNPRKDEETGHEMSISITPRASNRLLQIISKDRNPALCLRVSVESGGCHGFQYLMSLVDISKVSEEEDTLFISAPEGSIAAAGEAGWRAVADGKAKVVMDEPSLELLKGSKVDYTMELIGSQFKIADNPRASSSCGCGTSFDVAI